MMARERTNRIARELLSRREALGLLGSTAAAAALAGCGATGSSDAAAAGGGTTAAASGGSTALTPSCVLTPEVTEGPYYLDLRKVRKDITEHVRGVPLKLRTTVVDTADGCAPLENAAVDIWHCNATGEYSGFTAAGEGQQGQAEDSGAPPGGGAPPGLPPGGGGMEAEPTDDETFLRGVQLTSSEGVAEFATIYPGWYAGRTLHIHLKVIVDGKVSGSTYKGGHVSHTGQLFFPEDVTDRIAQLQPYASHQVELVRHAEDSIFQQAGEGSIVTLTPLEEGSVKAGYLAEITLGVDPDATPDPTGMGAGTAPAAEQYSPEDLPNPGEA
jgi:protocatechuate 3,4-dioxygenase beta subunit